MSKSHMKTDFCISILAMMISWLVLSLDARAQIIVPGANGSDGVLNPPTNIVIDLSLAPTGSWDADNAANSGRGVYDPDKWAVVFKYSSVNIPANVTIGFSNNIARAPVVWLVSGDVRINGTVSVRGETRAPLRFSEPGPGGFRGGRQRDSQGRFGRSGGFGIGGGDVVAGNGWGGPGRYATAYGSASIVPMIGGSGGSASDNRPSGGGGGAILIVAGGVIAIDGAVDANGGDGAPYDNYEASGGGSGGSVRLVSSVLTGDGMIRALGGAGYGGGGAGRIRVEAQAVSGNLKALPETSFFRPSDPIQLWPLADSPSVRLISVAGVQAPTDPYAQFNLPGADFNFLSTEAVAIVIETRNLDIGSSVYARIAPTVGNAVIVPAKFANGTAAQATWTASAVLPEGFAAIQARAVAP